MATNIERFFGGIYVVRGITVTDVSVYGRVYKVVRYDGRLVASVPEDRYAEWLERESTWFYKDDSTITRWSYPEDEE